MGPYRSSMDDLIARVRRYIGDPAGATQQFSALDIQNVLDEHRFTVRYTPLRPGPTLKPGALYDFLDYYSTVGNWEADAQLTWVDLTVLTPATSDLINGHWTFQLAAPGQYPPVYITGNYYDLHETAADLLEEWMALLATSAYTFSADGQSFQRGMIIANLQRAADLHRRKAMVVTTKALRGDIYGVHPAFTTGEGGPGDVTGADDS